MKTFTVTIAGTERFDGEAPYTWVVEATDVTSAMNKALANHALLQEQRLCDLEIDPLHTFEGLPPENCGYHWNDLRPAALRADGADGRD
ncbi:hypothetical protein [Nonomuraea sp. NPDC049028]|uniref:hypothetical protein n=1 Tax=Nonomuraea sp. NPDC049028 TaxID=3364348 RepID=UPI0037155C0A